MNITSRIVILIASIMIAVSIFLPLWHIRLIAPQYPEGIDLYIYANKLIGGTPYSIDQINVLNHYIGMQFIHPNSIPELHVVPYVLGFIALLGFIVVIVNKKPILYTWFTILIIGAVVGLADFYRWEYNYGHHLNPHAPIKIPGMSYQPPLIGWKQLLNIVAESYPSSGGYLVIIAGVLAFLIVAYELKFSKTKIEVKRV